MGWENGGEDSGNINGFMKDRIRIIFILGSISQPRVIKRIKSFVDNGFEVEVYGFDRNKYNVNAEIEGVNINIVGELLLSANELSDNVTVFVLGKDGRIGKLTEEIKIQCPQCITFK